MEIKKYKEHVKDFAFEQLMRGEDYDLNLGQINNMAARISAANNLPKDEVYDKLLSVVIELKESGYNPIKHLLEYYNGAGE